MGKADWFGLLARVGLTKHKAQEAQPNPFGFIEARH
jgi:hypothetical protein